MDVFVAPSPSFWILSCRVNYVPELTSPLDFRFCPFFCPLFTEYNLPPLSFGAMAHELAMAPGLFFFFFFSFPLLFGNFFSFSLYRWHVLRLVARPLLPSSLSQWMGQILFPPVPFPDFSLCFFLFFRWRPDFFPVRNFPPRSWVCKSLFPGPSPTRCFFFSLFFFACRIVLVSGGSLVFFFSPFKTLVPQSPPFFLFFPPLFWFNLLIDHPQRLFLPRWYWGTGLIPWPGLPFRSPFPFCRLFPFSVFTQIDNMFFFSEFHIFSPPLDRLANVSVSTAPPSDDPPPLHNPFSLSFLPIKTWSFIHCFP